jgi:hypothetical protein
MRKERERGTCTYHGCARDGYGGGGDARREACGGAAVGGGGASRIRGAGWEREERRRAGGGLSPPDWGEVQAPRRGGEICECGPAGATRRRGGVERGSKAG